MSFLNENTSEFLSARITKKGRNAIAKGNFKISFFQIGDSEYDYSTPFNVLNGVSGNPNQKVFSPFDKECGVKYPYKLDSETSSTTFGTPIQNSYTDTLKNVMGPAGFVTNYLEYDSNNCSGSGVMCTTTSVPYSTISGSTSINVPSGSTFNGCEYVTLVFDQFCGTDPNLPIITGETNSLIYKIVSISGNTIYFDRPTPNLSSLTGNAQVICNRCTIEYPSEPAIGDVCLPIPIDPSEQHDPWTLNVVWDDNPIGYTGITQNNLTGYTSNKWVSTKQFLGYTTSSGQTINSGTTYTNSFDDIIYVSPEEQRCIAIIHYSELGDINEPERFFKYDDYISGDNDINNSIVNDVNDNPITDTEYFEVYIPFILYHRNTGNTLGATFHMDTTDFYIETPTTIEDGRMILSYRYLLDEQNNKVGKVFYNNKTIVFDDQEIVAMLDYKSNRRHTLDAPKVFLVPSDLSPSNSLINGTTEQVFWVTYLFTNTDKGLNGLPCNYYTKISNTSNNNDGCITSIASNIGVKFNTTAFKYMTTSLSGVTDGFVGTDFKILVQETQPNVYPSPDLWREIDYTVQAGGDGINFLDPTNIVDKTFIINLSSYSGATFYSLEQYMGVNYFLGDNTFGDEQPFPGSVKVVRATDIEVMNFLINLPSTQFTTTQNPTYSTGKDKMITDITLLDSNKEVLVVAKTPKPIKRIGTQVFAVKLDF